MENFKKTIILQATDKSVYEALTNSIAKWWTEMFEGSSDKQDETFTIRFGSNVFKTLKVEELIPNAKVVWNVTDSVIDIPELKNKTEWINTKIIWEISRQDSQTEICLTHLGLTPEIECYNICESGWHNFTDSLTDFIKTGIGKPFKV
ncbi:SRPBCC family protein [Algoriphagus antarcticus]|uniref:Activator of Hsp90 ATPase-like protein n=1 Tax=Algoriphagus antarcticus TaxID=238540 RepID=A0A3E0D2D8_9BACT|nr:SRPBCC domain-containing protein [Algoriphagus antarcticus]REG76876.1 activator of Hsp90 ATPase-like protein [Algoriphagus antarcticus]